MKVALYIRTSTEDQEPENQIRDCESLCGKEYEKYIDKQSAWKDNKERDDFERLKKDIQAKKISDLYVWDLDRLYRNRIKLKEFIQFCKTYNCKLWSYRQKFLNQIQDLNLPKEFDFLRDMMLNNLIEMLGWIAEDESKKKSDRVKLAIRKETGITTSYKGNKWGRKNISDKVKSLILEAYNQNKTYSQICSEIFYWDTNGNKKYVSKGFVHKTIEEFKASSKSFSEGSTISQLMNK